MPSSSARPWPVTAGGYLLAAQGAASLGTSFALLEAAAGAARSPADWDAFAALVSLGAVCLALGVTAIANSLDFLRRHRSAWLAAMLIQGLSLALALLLYWRGHENYSYPLMAAGIFLVVHLHRGDVSELFGARSAPLTELPFRAGDAADDA